MRGMNFDTRGEVTMLVAAAGGPSELARRMGFASRQRIANWVSKGYIPAMVVRAYRPMFRRILASPVRRR